MKSAIRSVVITTLMITSLSVFAAFQGAKIEITVAGDQCNIIDAVGSEIREAHGMCKWFEDAKLIKKVDDGYALTARSKSGPPHYPAKGEYVMMKSGAWEYDPNFCSLRNRPERRNNSDRIWFKHRTSEFCR